jgi:hypothetical protein
VIVILLFFLACGIRLSFYACIKHQNYLSFPFASWRASGNVETGTVGGSGQARIGRCTCRNWIPSVDPLRNLVLLQTSWHPFHSECAFLLLVNISLGCILNNITAIPRTTWRSKNVSWREKCGHRTRKKLVK